MRLVPALSNVPAGSGPFTIYVVMDNLQHFGAITYDDNRDTVPDRSIPSVGLAAFQFTVTYNPAVISIANAEPGPGLERSGRLFQCLPPAREPDKFTFGCISIGDAPAGTQGTLTLGSVELMPVGSGLSPLQIEAEVTGPLGDGASVEAIGGAVRVTGNIQVKRTPTISSAQPSPQVTPTHSAVATPGLTATASPSASGTATPGATPTPGGPKPNGGSGGSGLWWAVGAGGAIASAALGLAAVLWRRAQPGSV